MRQSTRETRFTIYLPMEKLMNSQAKVWVADDDSSIRWVLERALNQAGIANESFEDADQLLQQIDPGRPDVIISDIRMPGTDGLELLSLINEAIRIYPSSLPPRTPTWTVRLPPIKKGPLSTCPSLLTWTR